MGNFTADLKYAIRALAKNPGFTAVAVVTLALGIGANSAIFSVVNGVILKPLQYDRPGELVMITGQFPNMGFDKFWMSVPEFLELKERNRSFANMGGYRTGEVSITGGDRPMRVNAGFATHEVLEVLGVSPYRGRIFFEDEDQPDGDAVFVMAYELWQGRFAGNEDLLGSTLPLADLQPMNDVLGSSVAQPRFLTLLLTIFAGVALALAAVGTYGVMSYSVAERSQELGVRIALGAKTPAILGLVLRQGLGVAVLGLAVGILGAIGLTRLLSSLLFEVSTLDVATFAIAPAVLAVVAVAACYIPARRATLVDPIEVLKAE